MCGLYNAATVFERGLVCGFVSEAASGDHGSVYQPGTEVRVFQLGDLTFGIVICNDSNYREPVRLMAERGATALFVPHNCIPPRRASVELVTAAREVDIANGVENGLWFIRADVIGQTEELVAFGSSAIADPIGVLVQVARRSGG